MAAGKNFIGGERQLAIVFKQYTFVSIVFHMMFFNLGGGNILEGVKFQLFRGGRVPHLWKKSGV